MPGLLPNAGEIVYNGFAFGATTETEYVSVVPRYDQAGRTTTHNKYLFRFKTHLIGPGVPDAAETTEARAVRQALTKAGGEFRYRGRGITLHINRPSGGGARDVDWGPKPQDVTFTPLGGGTLLVEWTLEVNVPDCRDAVYEFAPLEFSFSLTFGRTEDGRVTRQTSGFLRVPMTRAAQGDRTLPGSADDYRERVVGRLPVGFERRFDSFRIDPAKTRLDFSYTDTEMPANLLPPGITQARVRHRVSSGSAGLLVWQSTISATYHLDLLADPIDAALAFWALIGDRIGALAKGQKDAPPVAGGGSSRGMTGLASRKNRTAALTILPTMFDADEPDIHGRRSCSYTLGYTFQAELATVLTSSGLWRPVPGSEPGKRDATWRAWEASLRNSYLYPLGSARIRFDSRDDEIIDLCRDPEPIVGAILRGTNVPLRNVRAKEQVLRQSIVKAFPVPKPEESWIHYECSLVTETASGTVPVVLLPKPATGDSELRGGLLAGAFNPTGPSPDAMSPGSGRGFLSASAPPPPPPSDVRAHIRSQGVVYVTLVGSAIRAGYPIVFPHLDDIGGVKAVPANRVDRGEGTCQEPKAMYGLPVWFGHWRLRYVLPNLPAVIPLPPNPLLDTDPKPQEPR